MRKGQPRRWAVYPYTDRELQIVELRVKGIRPREIADRLMLTPRAVYCRLSRLYIKAGIAGAHELNDWAYVNGFDELGTETEETREIVQPKVRRTKTRIRMNRIKRAAK